MSAPTSIDDPDDPRLADYRALNDAALRRSIEGDRVCIAEGAFVVARLLRSPFAVRSFLVSDRKWPSLGELGDAINAHEAPTFVVAQRVMNAVAGFD
ncbi:MAG TPA: RNA methyltransferase, partial [Acidimicrobiales bacterium]|nr:RNA methyltransferase [Acidimicrobiales bacterium]